MEFYDTKEAEADLQELELLLEQAKRPKSKAMIQAEIVRIKVNKCPEFSCISPMSTTHRRLASQPMVLKQPHLRNKLNPHLSLPLRLRASLSFYHVLPLLRPIQECSISRLTSLRGTKYVPRA